MEQEEGRRKEKEREKEKKKKGKKKTKGKEEREEKEEKKEGAPAGFAAAVASRSWHRREATCTRNEGNRKKKTVTDAGVGTANRQERFRETRGLEKI